MGPLLLIIDLVIMCLWTAERPGQGGCGRSPAAPDSGALPRPVTECRGLPAVRVPPQPANADGNNRSAHGSPKHVSKPEGASKTEASVEARSAR